MLVVVLVWTYADGSGCDVHLLELLTSTRGLLVAKAWSVWMVIMVIVLHLFVFSFAHRHGNAWLYGWCRDVICYGVYVMCMNMGSAYFCD